MEHIEEMRYVGCVYKQILLTMLLVLKNVFMEQICIFVFSLLSNFKEKSGNPFQKENWVPYLTNQVWWGKEETFCMSLFVIQHDPFVEKSCWFYFVFINVFDSFFMTGLSKAYCNFSVEWTYFLKYLAYRYC